MSALCGQIKAAMESLNSFRPTLDHLGSARDAVEMIMDLGKPLSGVKYCWLEIVEFYGIKSIWFYEVGRFFFLTLIVWLIDFPAFRGSGPISWSNEKPCKQHGNPSWPTQQAQTNSKVRQTGCHYHQISQNDGRSGGFLIQKWLKNWTRTYEFIWDRFFTESVVLVKYILVAVQKGKKTELRDNLDAFADKFDRDLLLIEIIEVWSVCLYSLSKLSNSWYQPP